MVQVLVHFLFSFLIFLIFFFPKMTESSATFYEQSPNVKIVLLGDSSVGKTTIINITQGKDFATDQQSTIGACFYIKKIKIDDTIVKLHIWDTAGQERFRSISPMYFRDADVIILVYAINNVTSFQSMRTWYQSIKDTCVTMPKILVFANKIDLEERVVSKEDGAKFAQEINSPYFEISAKTMRNNIIQIFDSIASDLLEEIKKQNEINFQNSTVQIKESFQQKNKKGCC